MPDNTKSDVSDMLSAGCMRSCWIVGPGKGLIATASGRAALSHIGTPGGQTLPGPERMPTLDTHKETPELSVLPEIAAHTLFRFVSRDMSSIMRRY